jgi:predicted short-subunit dehydrogenase-like oxidoreductase (DUF2520 family)
MLGAIDVPGPAGVLGPLAAGTVANSTELGRAAFAITGPVARGDVATIKKHINALRERSPHLLSRYRFAARLIIGAAQENGALDPEASRKVFDALESE